MQRFYTILLVTFCCLVLGCEEKQEASKEVKRELNENKLKKFAPSKKLSEIQETEFLPTLESEITEGKSSIYCATLLYAWDEVRKNLESPIVVNERSKELTLLNNSTSYIGVLDSGEYVVDGFIKRNRVIATAGMQKSLLYKYPLPRITNKMSFADSVAVFALGKMKKSKKTEKTIKILYYENDSNFVIKLATKDSGHEVILMMNEKKFTNFIEMTDELANLRVKGRNESEQAENSWRYTLFTNDIVSIPKFNFNITSNYQEIEGKSFISNHEEYKIVTAGQTNAFLLDETGVGIKSNSRIEGVKEVRKESEHDKSLPKKLIFDKPFSIFMKKANLDNPYFAMWVENSELMLKE